MDKKKIYKSKDACCGCTACYSVCPVKAISMSTDEEGFLYPQINMDKCIECKICEQVCPLKLEKKLQNTPLCLYAVKNKKEYERINSTSGGVFSVIAEYVEQHCGVIYGAAFDEQYKVTHMRAESHGEWKKFCVSKYSQSDLKNTYEKVNKDLKNNRVVLFSGTPCQVDGLKSYLDKKKVPMDKLITCDIVCHGVPSPKIWDDYIKYLKKCTSKKIGYISFRDKKETGWHNSRFVVKDKENEVLISDSHEENYYYQLFACHYILRQSCHKCKYSNFYRPGDISLGDFWGVEKKIPDFDDDKGISLVMINSENGRNIWKKISDKVESIDITLEQAIQPNLQSPSPENPNRNNFWYWYKKYGFYITGQKMGFIRKNIKDTCLIYIYRCLEKINQILKTK